MNEVIIELNWAHYRMALQEKQLDAPKDSVFLDLYNGHDFSGVNVLQVNQVFLRFLQNNHIDYKVRCGPADSQNCA